MRESFSKIGFTSAYSSCPGKVLVLTALLKFAWKNLEKMSELSFIILIGMLSLWVAFKASKARISLQISSIVTNLKEKQSEEFLASLILRTLAWWEKLSIALRTESSLKSDYIGRSILRVTTIFPKWSLNILTSFSCYNLFSFDNCYSLIFESLVSTIWLDNLPYSLSYFHWEDES